MKLTLKLSYIILTGLLVIASLGSTHAQKKTRSSAVFLKSDLISDDPLSFRRELYDSYFSFLAEAERSVEDGLINFSRLTEEQRKSLQYYTSKFNLSLKVNNNLASETFNTLSEFDDINIQFEGVLKSFNTNLDKKETRVALKVNYKNGVETYREYQSFTLEDIVYARFDIQYIKAENNGVPVELIIANLPSNEITSVDAFFPFVLKLELEGQIISRTNYAAIQNNQFQVRLDKDNMDLVVNVDASTWSDWADGIELEWTFSEDYKGSGNSHINRYNDVKASETIRFDFEHNSTNVILDRFDYRIPLIFERGIVAFRFRPIIFLDENRDTIIHGDWYPNVRSNLSHTYPNNFKFSWRTNLITPHSQNHIIHTNDGLNWVHDVSYSGYGIRSDKVTYHDALQKNRQSLYRDPEDYALFASETIYDRLGFAAIEVPPAPVSIVSNASNQGRGFLYELLQSLTGSSGEGSDNNSEIYQKRTPQFRSDFRYIGLLNRPENNENNAYSWRDFDVYDYSTSINERVALPMSTNSGAAQYYSTNNPYQEESEATLPNAHGYPFIQIERSVERSSKISRLGGLGDAFQLGTQHENKFYDVTPTEEEIDRYFGNDAGFASNYSKKIIIDANGQAHVSISNNKGKVILSALAGSSPNNTQALEASNNLFTETINVLNYDDIHFDEDWKERKASANFFINAPQKIKLEYTLTPQTFSFDTCRASDVDVCLNCLYELSIELKNIETGQTIYTHNQDVVPEQLFCSSDVVKLELTFPESSSTDNLAIGRYRATRVLKLRKTTMEQNLNSLVNKPCREFNNQIPAWLRANPCADTDAAACRRNCDVQKQNYIQNLRDNNTAETGGPYTEDQIIQRADAFYNSCLLSCNSTNDDELINPIDAIKELMLADLSPGGQYAEYEIRNSDGTLTTIVANGLERNSFRLSIFNTYSGPTGRNEGNALSGSFNYTRPVQSAFNRIDKYLNEHNEIDFVILDEIDAGRYNHLISRGAEEIVELEDRRLKIQPHLLNVNDFIAHFKPSWAYALLPYHPEYLVLYWFETNPKAKESFLYDQILSRVISYQDAVDQGFVNRNAHSKALLTSDPLYGVEETVLREKFRTLESKLFGLPQMNSSNLNLEQYAVTTVHCLNPETGITEECMRRKMGQNDARINDEEWTIYKNLYLNYKQKILECFIHQKIQDFRTYSPEVISRGDRIPLNRDMAKIERKDAEGLPVDELYGKKTKYFKTIAEKLSSGECFNIVEDICSDDYDNLIVLISECVRTRNEIANNQRCFSCPISNDLTALLIGINRVSPLNVTYDRDLFIGYPVPYSESLMQALKIPPRSNNIRWTVQSYTDFDAQIAITVNNVPVSYLKFESFFEGAATSSTSPGPVIWWDKISTFTCLNLKNSSEKNKFIFKAVYKPEYASEIGANYVLIEGESLHANSTSIPPGINFVDCSSSQNQCTANAQTLVLSMIFKKLFDQNRYKERNVSLRLGFRGPEHAYYRQVTKQFVRDGLRVSGDPNIDLYDVKWTFLPSASTNTLIKGALTFVYGSNNRTIYLDIHVGEGEIPDDTRGLSLVSQKVNPRHPDQCEFKSYSLRFLAGTNFFSIAFDLPDEYSKPCCNLRNAAECVTSSITRKGQQPITQEYCRPCCPELPFNPNFNPIDPCTQLTNNLSQIIWLSADNWVQQERELRKQEYINRCMDNPDENFTITIQNGLYQVTLYYYDAAGNIVATVPPEGVMMLSDDQLNSVRNHRQLPGAHLPVYPLLSAHKLISKYKYNTANRLVYSENPDKGITKYFYDEYGRVRFIQDQDQINAFGTTAGSRKKGGYILYDDKNRVAESGVAIITSTKWSAIKIAGNEFKLQNLEFKNMLSNAFPLVNNPSASIDYKSEIIKIHYDAIHSTEANDAIPGGQRFLVNRKAAVTYHPNGILTDYEHGKFYTYTLSGQVKYFLQINRQAAIPEAHQKKIIHYVYDPLTAEASEVHYQPGMADQFYHRYHFYKNGKFKSAYTSTDRHFWKREAFASYRRDGSVDRFEVGEGLQGLDLTFTLDGKLKALNNLLDDPNKDPGKDGLEDGARENIPPDLGGFVFHYFNAESGKHNGDYTPIQTSAIDFSISGQTLINEQLNNHGMYNGFITALSQKRLGKDLIQKAYQYDQLGRLVKNSNLYGSSDAWGSTYQYDQNGNFTQVKRQDQNNTTFDDLQYELAANKNRLNKVVDEAPASQYPYDLEGITNFDYNSNGTLKKLDNEDEFMEVEWNSAYRPTKIRSNCGETTIHYDAAMNRSAERINSVYTRYVVRDNSGNIMAIYNISGGQIELHSTPIYGVNRLAVYRHNKVLTTLNVPNSEYHEAECGKRIYEFKSATGDVMVLYSDKKQHNGTHFTNTILLDQDYIPYGLPIVENADNEVDLAPDYPYGFQGMEYDASCFNDESGKRKYSTFYRLYDASLAMWLSPDPKANASQSPYFAFNGNPIMYTDKKGDVPAAIVVGGLLGLGSGLVGEYISYRSDPDNYSMGWGAVRVLASTAVGAINPAAAVASAELSLTVRIGTTVGVGMVGAVGVQAVNNGTNGRDMRHNMGFAATTGAAGGLLNFLPAAAEGSKFVQYGYQLPGGIISLQLNAAVTYQDNIDAPPQTATPSTPEVGVQNTSSQEQNYSQAPESSATPSSQPRPVEPSEDFTPSPEYASDTPNESTTGTPSSGPTTVPVSPNRNTRQRTARVVERNQSYDSMNVPAAITTAFPGVGYVMQRRITDPSSGQLLVVYERADSYMPVTVTGREAPPVINYFPESGSIDY